MLFSLQSEIEVWWATFLETMSVCVLRVCLCVQWGRRKVHWACRVYGGSVRSVFGRGQRPRVYVASFQLKNHQAPTPTDVVARRLVLFGGRGGDGLERPTRVAEEVGRPRRHRGGEAEAFARSEQMSGESRSRLGLSYCSKGCPGRGGSHASMPMCTGASVGHF